MSTDPAQNEKPVSKAAWKKNAFHSVMCPSGSRITIKIPDIAVLVQSGTLPQNLIDVALGRSTSTSEEISTQELVKQEVDFTNFITLSSVVEPAITEADLPEIPFEDRDFLVSIATRRRDLDVEGEHIAGLSKSEKFRRFRRLGEFSEDVEGL